MPIVSCGDRVEVKYTIPEEIDSQIPDYFYPALAGELFSVFGPSVYEPIDGVYSLNTSTHGWHEAMQATCDKLGLGWLMSYYNSLTWYDSDMFDGIIEDRVVRIIEQAGSWESVYYTYLINH